MKNSIKTMKLFALLFLISFSACKKDGGESRFDLKNPVGYFIYLNTTNEDGTWPMSGLLEFRPGKTLKLYDVSPSGDGEQVYPYDVIDGNILNITGFNYRFVIENGSITTENSQFKQVALIKGEATNQLAGKTFAGTYYKSDNSVLHSSFFYTFSGDGNKYSAGFKPGTTAARTGNYSTIGNIAVRSVVPGTKEIEFLVLVNGKLEVNYYQYLPYQRHYGSFTSQ